MDIFKRLLIAAMLFFGFSVASFADGGWNDTSSSNEAHIPPEGVTFTITSYDESRDSNSSHHNKVVYHITTNVSSTSDFSDVNTSDSDYFQAMIFPGDTILGLMACINGAEYKAPDAENIHSILIYGDNIFGLEIDEDSVPGSNNLRARIVSRDIKPGLAVCAGGANYSPDINNSQIEAVNTPAAEDSIFSSRGGMDDSNKVIMIEIFSDKGRVFYLRVDLDGVNDSGDFPDRITYKGGNNTLMTTTSAEYHELIGAPT